LNFFYGNDGLGPANMLATGSGIELGFFLSSRSAELGSSTS